MLHAKERMIAVLAAAALAATILGSILAPPIGALPSATPSQGLGSPMTPAQPSGAPQVASITSGSWSDPKTWDKGVPVAGDNVLISTATTVTYEQSTSPILGAILVQGSLVFSSSVSTTITFTNMTVDINGYLEAGTASNPIPATVTTTLTMAPPVEGGSLIHVMGQLEIHGSPVNPTWTRLAAAAMPGDRTLDLVTQVSWKAGDHIVVTSTSLNPMESEENWVTAVSGNKVTLQQPLKYEHDGTAPTQGEVADLTRNVVVTSLNPQIHATGIMFMYGAKGGISYAEFSHLGGMGLLGHYPIHFHHVQDSMVGTVIDGVSVWDSHNRFITIHNTDGITVEDSVGYKSIGHGFFLEDGTEENNTLVHNIAILTLPGKIRPDDGGAAGFWVQNPRNNLTDNVAVSASGSGFDYQLPDMAPDVIPFNEGNFQASLNQATVPRQLKILGFVNNEAHSNRGDGIHLYRLGMVRHGTISWFSGMAMWRNNNVGADITGAQYNITASSFFGNRNGNLRIDATDGTISNSQFLGELDGVQTGTSPGRFATAPFGVVLTGTHVTIANSLFKGHVPRGTMAAADVINSPRDFSLATVTIANTQLLSTNTIIFGYPLNGTSHYDVVNLDGNSGKSFTLLRYDLQSSAAAAPSSSGLKQLLSQCAVDQTYMALKCPLIPASAWKNLHP
jgi:hypothetical protein